MVSITDLDREIVLMVNICYGIEIQNVYIRYKDFSVKTFAEAKLYIENQFNRS